MARYNRNRSNFNRVHPFNYQRPAARPTPQVQVPIYYDAKGYFVVGQIGGFYYRIPVTLNQPRQDSSNTTNQRPVPPKPKGKDPYEVLGISKSATMPEITKAFRKKAKENHPDMKAQMPEDQRAYADKRMKEINEAYGFLKALNKPIPPNQGNK